MKAVIFDFDGTLANTLPICYYAFQSVFKEFDKKNFSPNEIKSMFGPSETEIIKKHLKNPNKGKAIELYYKKYLENHSNLVRHNVEIDEMIKYLRDHDIKLGIVTGKARRSLDISFKALQMDHSFDVIITGDDVSNPKPHPEGVIKALSLLGVEHDEAMFIGDSDADILAGSEANLYTVGVQWLQEFQTLEFKIEPDSFFSSINQFIDFINTDIIRLS